MVSHCRFAWWILGGVLADLPEISTQVWGFPVSAAHPIKKPAPDHYFGQPISVISPETKPEVPYRLLLNYFWILKNLIPSATPFSVVSVSYQTEWFFLLKDKIMNENWVDLNWTVQHGITSAVFRSCLGSDHWNRAIGKFTYCFCCLCKHVCIYIMTCVIVTPAWSGGVYCHIPFFIL